MVGASSIEDMLQGQLAGLSVVNTSAAPGAAPKIRVRGTATIAGNADPLWVLDGVMLENSVPITVAELNSPDVMNMFNSAIGGVYNETNYEQRTSLIRNSLEYKGKLAEDFSIDAMLGQEFRTTLYKGLTLSLIHI